MVVVPGALVTVNAPVACVLPKGMLSVELTPPTVGCEEKRLMLTAPVGSFAGRP